MSDIKETPLPFYTPPTQLERLQAAQDGPKAPSRQQRPADHGLFDLNARNQTQLFD